MARRGKRLKAAYEGIDSVSSYGINEAIKIIKDAANSKFDETIDIAINLGVDPKHADQMVRGIVTLPHGTGKALKVAVFAKGDQAKAAEAAGADIVGVNCMRDPERTYPIIGELRAATDTYLAAQPVAHACSNATPWFTG